jgi:hypothetical protein
MDKHLRSMPPMRFRGGAGLSGFAAALAVTSGMAACQASRFAATGIHHACTNALPVGLTQAGRRLTADTRATGDAG